MLDETPEVVREVAGGPVALCVFGKHPAWADHMEDLGSMTSSLSEFKYRFYQDGVRSQLDAGAWNKLPDDCRIEGWNHEWLTLGPSGTLLARIWKTVDGRGRSSYPMVGAIQLPTSRPPESFASLFGVLADLEKECMASTDSRGVVDAVAGAKAKLPGVIGGLAPQSEIGIGVEERRLMLSSLSEERAPAVSIERLIHQLGIRTAFGEAVPSLKATVRLPMVSSDFSDTASFWRAFSKGFCSPNTLWTIRRFIGADWADMEVGEFSADSVYRLRCNSNQIPVVTDIPFNIPSETRASAASFLDAFASGAQPAIEAKAKGLWSKLRVPWVGGGG